MNNINDWLREFMEIFLLKIDWVVVSALISAFATSVMVCFTYITLRENKNLKLAGEKPYVLFNLEVEYTGLLLLSVENLGSGPALDIHLSITEPVNRDDYDYDGFGFNKIPRSILLLKPREKRSFGIGLGYKLCHPTWWANELENARKTNDYKKIEHMNYDYLPLKPFIINATYKTISGRTVNTQQTLDIEKIMNIPGILAKPPIVRIAEALEQTVGVVNNIRKDVSTLEHSTRNFMSISQKNNEGLFKRLMSKLKLGKK